MLFISAEDFFAQAGAVTRLTRDQEKVLARQMAAGDEAAREELIRSYLPMVAGFIRRSPRDLHTLQTVYICLDALQKGVDSFNFLQDREPFTHHLSWRLRQAITRCIADQ